MAGGWERWHRKRGGAGPWLVVDGGDDEEKAGGDGAADGRGEEMGGERKSLRGGRVNERRELLHYY